MTTKNHDDRDRDPSAGELLLQRYADGELRAGERRDLEARLTGEPELAERLEELQRVRDVFASARAASGDPAPLGLGFAGRVWSELQRDGAEAPAPIAGATIKGWTLLAASIALLLGGLLLFWQPDRATVMEAGPEVHDWLRELDRKADAEDARVRQAVEAARREEEARRAKERGDRPERPERR